MDRCWLLFLLLLELFPAPRISFLRSSLPAPSHPRSHVRPSPEYYLVVKCSLGCADGEGRKVGGGASHANLDSELGCRAQRRQGGGGSQAGATRRILVPGQCGGSERARTLLCWALGEPVFMSSGLLGGELPNVTCWGVGGVRKRSGACWGTKPCL